MMMIIIIIDIISVFLTRMTRMTRMRRMRMMITITIMIKITAFPRMMILIPSGYLT